MQRPLRLAVLSLLLLGGCALFSDPAPSTTLPPAPPPPVAPVSTAKPAPGDEAWLGVLQQDVARIRAGEQVAAGRAPMVTPTSVTPVEVPAAVQPAPPVAPPVAPVAVPSTVSEPAPSAAPVPAPQPAPSPAAALPSLSSGDLAQLMAQSRAHAALADERVGVLVQAYLAEGLAALEAGDLQAAYGHFANAWELDPADPAAASLFQQVATVLGKPGAGLMAVAADARQRAEARGDQARLLVQHDVAQGDAAMAADDPERAQTFYQDALTLLRADPAAAGSIGEAELAARIAVARRAAEDRASRQADELASRAAEQAELLDRAETERLDRRIEQLMSNANAAFLRDEYEVAEAALDEVLALDAGHQEAIGLKRIAARARHDRRDRVTRETYRNEWQDTFDEMLHDMVPPNDVMSFPDDEDWAEIVARGNKTFGSAGTSLSGIDAAVADKLEKAVPVSFEGEPLDQVLAHLSAVTGVSFLLSPAVRADADTSYEYNFSDKAAKPVSRTLKVLLEDLTLPPLTYLIKDGVVKIITRDEARSDYVLQMYDIRDLTFTPVDYPAQDFNLLPSGTDADTFRDGVEDEEPVAFIGPDALLSLIQDNISPDSWTSDPERTIQLMPGTLIVRQTPDVHAQIKQLLDDLRVNTHTLINIETRFVEVEDSFLEDIGVDLRGLDGSLTNNFPLEDFGQSGAGGFSPGDPTGIGTGNDPGFFYGGKNGDLKGRTENLFDTVLGEPGTLNNSGGLSMQALFLDDTNVQAVLRAIAKYQTSNIVNAPSLTLRSGQRGNVKSMTTQTYVRDFEPEIAQAAVIAQPELDNVRNGVMLDVRAVASADLRFITMELRPTVVELVPDEQGNEIRTEVVSLATQNSSDVSIQLPELRIQRLRTTATIPDGGTLMLGGLKRSVEQQQSSGVPFLSDIPLLGSIFSRSGEYTSKRKLIILLKASIIAPEEHEPSPGFRR